MDIAHSRHQESITRIAAAGSLRYVQLAILAIAVALALLIAWTFNRGLELTDEAFYILTSMHPDAFRFFFTPTQWVSGPLWQLSGGLMGFRAVGWAILTLASCVMGAGVVRAATPQDVRAQRGPLYEPAVVATTAIFAWLYGAILPFSPSYNSLGAAGAYAAVGLFLLTVDSESRPRVLASAVGAGILLGLSVLSKFSSGIATAGMILMLHVAMRGRQVARAQAALLMVVTLVATVVVAVIVESSFHDAYRAFQMGLELTRVAQGNETAFARVLRGLHECGRCATVVLATYWGALLLACVAAVLRSAPAGCAAVAWFVYDVVSGHYWAGGMDVYQTQSRPLVAATFLMLLLTLRVWGGRWRLFMLCVLLFVLPLVIAIGTGNPLPFQIMLALASWGALCGLLAFVDADHATRVPAAVMALVFVALSAAQIVSGDYRAPYRLAHSIEAQRLTVDAGRLGTLKVDPETRRFVGELREASRRCALPSGMAFLGVYRIPGVALVLDDVPLATPWLFSKAFADAALDGMDPQKVRGAVVALQLAPDGARPELPEQLRSIFPDQYRFCGASALPFGGARVQLWAPKHASSAGSRTN